MKKKIILFIILFLVFFISCSETPKEENKEEGNNNNTEIKDEKNYNVKLLTDDIVMALDEVYELKLEKDDNSIYNFEYDEEYLKILDDKIIPTKVGSSNISLVANEKIIKTINVFIYEVPANLQFVDVPKDIKIGEVINIKTNNSDVIFSIDSDNVTLDQDAMTLTGVKEGKVTLKATYIYDETIFVEKEITISNNIIKADFVFVYDDIDNNVKENDEVIIDDYSYKYGVNLFKTIKDALKKYEGINEIIYIGSTSEKSVVVPSEAKINGSKLISPLELVLTIESGARGVIIEEMKFTGDSKIILSSGNNNIHIQNNTFDSVCLLSNNWVETNKYTSGVIVLENSDVYHNDIIISNNSFNVVGDCCINVSTTHDIIIKGNKFYEFYRDAVRFNNGIIKKTSTWQVTGNTFQDGDYNAVFFRTYGSDGSDIYHYVNVRENYISCVGKKGGDFVGAVTFRNYQEGGACVDVSYNTFNGCSKYIFLRNNAVSARQENFHGYVVGNVFETVPSKYYFNNLNNSGDSFSTNPKQTKLMDNAYLDDGKDITPNSNLFIGALSNTRLSSEKVKALYHFELNHVLFVGKKVVIFDDITSYDNTKFSIETTINEIDDNNLNFSYTLTFTTIEAKEEGTFTLKHNNDSFEVVCIKNIELVVKFINIALGEVGYQEMDANGNTGTSGNYTKYGAWYGINPGAWCAMFVSWCANQAGVSTAIIPKYAAVQAGMEWYKEQGLFKYKEEYTPKAGDIMFMKSNGASHTGIVLYCDGKTLYTVEGNTNDCCACRKYDVTNSKITGYGLPQWPYYSPSGYNFSDGKAQDGSGNKTT